MIGEQFVLDHDEAVHRIDSGAAKPFGFEARRVLDQIR